MGLPLSSLLEKYHSTILVYIFFHSSSIFTFWRLWNNQEIETNMSLINVLLLIYFDEANFDDAKIDLDGYMEITVIHDAAKASLTLTPVSIRYYVAGGLSQVKG